MPNTESLPLEIMGMILVLLASPEDLASAIKASSRALAALQCDRRKTLTAIICNNLSPRARKEAVSILNLPVFEDGDVMFGSQLLTPKRWYQKRHEFDVWYRQSTLADPMFSTEITNITALYRMRATVNELAADLVAYTNAMANAAGACPALYAPKKTSLECLTSEELDRIQVAFLRYELMCRLTGPPYMQLEHHLGGHLTSDDQVHKPCINSYAWDFEGLRHVNEYLYSKYNLAFKEIDDDITALVNDTPAPEDLCCMDIEPPLTALRIIEDNIDGPLYLESRARRLKRRWDFDSDMDYLIYKYITNLSELGIGTLRSFLRKERIERRQFINETFCLLLEDNGGIPDESEGPTPNYYPVMSGFNFHRYTLKTDVSVREPGECESIALHAWQEANKTSRDLTGSRFAAFDRYLADTDKLSWSFWGIKRLKQLGLATEDSTESEVVLNYDIQVQKTYQEKRDEDPELRVLWQEVDEEKWEEQFKAQFYTTPSIPGRLEDYYPQLRLILQFAEDSKIEK